MVGMDKAAFKPLNAYLLMADLETDENWEILHERQSLEDWTRREINGKIGYDPTLTPISIPQLKTGWIDLVVYDSFAKFGKELVPVMENLIDLIAVEQKQTEAISRLWILKQEFTGMNSYDKLQYLRQRMRENSCDCYVVTALDEIAWLLNSISVF